MLPKPELEWDYNLGDIVLGMPVISEVCESEGVKLVDRLPVIVTHALCHLIGHCHGNEAQWNKVCGTSCHLLDYFLKDFFIKCKHTHTLS